PGGPCSGAVWRLALADRTRSGPAARRALVQLGARYVVSASTQDSAVKARSCCPTPACAGTLARTREVCMDRQGHAMLHPFVGLLNVRGLRAGGDRGVEQADCGWAGAPFGGGGGGARGAGARRRGGG